MKRYIAILLFVVALPMAVVAQVRTSYFMEGSTFRTDMNPALAPTRGYINFPLLGGVSLGVNNNFLSIENMLYPTDKGLVTFLNSAVDRNDFLKRLPRNNALEINVSEQLFGFGAHTKRFFWSAGANVRINADMNIPKEFFSLVTTLGQGSYDMKGMNLGANAYLEAYVGAAIPVKEIATIGFRVKGLFGVASSSMKISNMVVDVNDEYVSANLRGQMQVSGPMFNSLPVGEPVDFESMILSDPTQLLDFSSGRFNNGGMAVDLGAEVRLLEDNLRLSAAVTDLGFLCWNKNSTVVGRMGGAIRYEGVDFDSGDANMSNEPLEFVGAAVDKGVVSRLNCSLNIGAEYAILRNRISFGVLSHTKFCQTFNYSELTASVNFKPLNWITATVSHTFLNKNQPGVFGFALNLHPTGFNLFLGADFIDLKYAKSTMGNGMNMLLPIRQRSFNLNMGLGFSLGRAKYSKAYKDDLAAGRIKSKNKK